MVGVQYLYPLNNLMKTECHFPETYPEYEPSYNTWKGLLIELYAQCYKTESNYLYIMKPSQKSMNYPEGMYNNTGNSIGVKFQMWP